ncbi:MAG TPA: hypothetical protein VNO55_04895 [Polyangia bacterium]|nr:hypothetical protein [Polyangia bacterium]
MKHPREPNGSRSGAGPASHKAVDKAVDNDSSDLVELKAIAASTRAGHTPPVLSAAELSGVMARRDSVVGARVTGGADGLPPWIWGMAGCLSVMALGLGIFWYLNAPPRSASAEADPGSAFRHTEQPLATPPLGPQIVPLPPRPEPPAPEPARAEKEKPTPRHLAGARAGAHPGTLPSPRAEPSDTADVPTKKSSDLDTLLAAPPGGPGASSDQGAQGTVDPERALKDVDAALEGLQPKVHQCFRRFQIRGVAQVKLTVSPSGSIESPAVTGDFEGTPTGDCVINELASAALPPFKGGPVSISHSFVFR